MPLYRDEAVVLHTHDLGEADRIITMLARHHGRLRAVAKGVRRTSSKFGARLEPFSVVDLQCFEGRTLDTVTQAVTLANFGAAVAGDYTKYTAGTVMLEAAERLSAETANPALYRLTVSALRSLARGEHDPVSTADAFLLRALSLSGWAPSFADCARCGARGPHRLFSAVAGGMVCDTCAPSGSLAVEPRTLEVLAGLLSGVWELVDGDSDDDALARARAHEVTSKYTQYHLERRVRSLRHLDGQGT
ncbi:DNA repair protein RecO [Pseudoclavibacter sp. CFCC 13611]|uniref:DNA repair protein RecO n=1 Tax=Pseudoclavibacter sp. CFCC 13611 TaxID=2615178 RepID=UPI0013011279|nr:DNA repair protein RecO [Pseudoclavibacter sp. CFCC 13611]KAB1663643.1 DNA repair protein RecO [Pseudoclavibacter sp. CFCC 13611]KAB1664608.1 DNA repair protein RecO [Pseudoclavibacter sp. CFCC 13611]